ncbi:MAG: FAD-dependent monooxygenase, partial [Acidimicrobiia bacterium]
IDYLTYHDLSSHLVRWSAIDIKIRGNTLRSHGHGFSALSRRALLGSLADRAVELGVTIRHETELHPDRGDVHGFDLVVAADGVNSVWRDRYPADFGPSLDLHPTRYIWLGTPFAFEAFTFIFEETPWGLFQVHAYPYDAGGSTFIVETTDAVFHRAQLEQAGEAESLAFCEKLFVDHLQGHGLFANQSRWSTFVTLRTRSWYRLGAGAPLVLLGDAAHTAHFSIGSGTKLAMEDAASLHQALMAHPNDVATALAVYEQERQTAVSRFQEAARDSARYFENVSHYLELPLETFAFNLLTRSGRISHLDMERRDPALTVVADRRLTDRDQGLAVERPHGTPLRIGSLHLANRLVSASGSGWGAGLWLTAAYAVEPEGRSFPDAPVLAAEGDETALSLELARSRRQGAVLGVVIGHAGARGGCRPPEDGFDRPLARGGWETLACSSVPYTPAHQPPRQATATDLERVEERFAASAKRAAAAGAQLLVVDAAQGNLLAGFLSPLTNHRLDRFGGDLAGRLRFPLLVLQGVRRVWDGLLAVRYSATDWVDGGTTIAEAVAIARSFLEVGVDLVEVAGGGTLANAYPLYRRGFLLPLATDIRLQAGVTVMVGGAFTTLDEVDTALAAGRADLIKLDPYRYQRPLTRNSMQ